MKIFSRFALPAILAFGALLLILQGCSKEQTIQPARAAGITAEADAAEAVATSLGEYNGGAIDQIGDLCTLASVNGVQSLNKNTEGDQTEDKEATFDPASGTWTIVLTRERGSVDGTHYAKIERTFQVQFLNQTGQPQQFYITNGDTAYSITMNVIDASGEHHTPKVDQELKELQASFVATGTNTPMITINGTYLRSAMNTLTTERVVRTHDGTVDLTFTDVVGPRGSRMDLAQKVSGTVSGTYQALITFTRGDAYSERTIDREINIVLGSGTADIQIHGGGKFQGDLYWGQCKGQ